MWDRSQNRDSARQWRLKRELEAEIWRLLENNRVIAFDDAGFGPLPDAAEVRADQIGECVFEVLEREGWLIR